MVVELPKVKQNFANIVESLTPQPWTMLQFIIWLDLKLAEYKVSGYMVLDQSFGEMPDWLGSLNIDQSDEQTSDFSSSKESGQQFRAVPSNQTTPQSFHEARPGGMDDFSIATNSNRAQRRPPQQRGPAISNARSTGVRQRSDSPILIDDADLQHRQFRQSAPQLQQRGADNYRSSPAKRTSGSLQSPVQTQSFSDPKRQRVASSQSQFSVPRDEVIAPVREFPSRNASAARISNQNVPSEAKTTDNTQASHRESRSLRSSNRPAATSNEAPATDVIAPDISDRVPGFDTSPVPEEQETKPFDPSVTDSPQDEAEALTQNSTEAVNPFADFKIVKVAGGEADISASSDLENVSSPPPDPVPTRLYQHEEFKNRNRPSTSTGQSGELEHTGSIHSETLADTSYDNFSQDDTLEDSSTDLTGDVKLEPDESTSNSNFLNVTEMTTKVTSETADVVGFLPNNRVTVRNQSQYLKYSPEMRAKMAHYALQFGTSNAVRKFSADLGVNIPRTTVHNMKKAYLHKMAAQNLK